MTFHQIPIVAISPFHHLICFSISLYQVFYHFTISPYKLSCHIAQQFYQCIVLPYFISDCSEASYVDRKSPNYMSTTRKYETGIHITPEYLGRSPSWTQINIITMEGLEYSRNLVAAKPPSAIIIVLQVGFCVYALNYGYFVTFRKKDEIEPCMQCTFTHQKMCSREGFPKEMRTKLRYACNKHYSLKQYFSPYLHLTFILFHHFIISPFNQICLWSYS